jgi:hypothetical protein
MPSDNLKFNYCQAIGKLIYAMVTCQPDISFPLIKLSQYSINPTKEHYKAVQEIFYFLRCTDNEGIHYWRPQKHPDLPAPQHSYDDETTECKSRIQDTAHIIKAATDSDWGGDTKHQKSITGFIIKLAGGCIYYKSRYQPTIALSSTEAEFVVATDTGKAILYICTILHELGIQQKDATILHIYNNGALNMANQQQPTKSTRHMELKKFAIQQWVEHNLLYLKRISTDDNYADAMAKQLGRTKYYTHFDYIMGHLRPSYAQNFEMTKSNFTENTTLHAWGVQKIDNHVDIGDVIQQYSII